MGEKVLFLRGGDGELPWSFILMHKDGNQSENKENLVKSSRLRFVLLPGPSAERQPFLQKRQRVAASRSQLRPPGLTC